MDSRAMRITNTWEDNRWMSNSNKDKGGMDNEWVDGGQTGAWMNDGWMET